MFTQTCLLGQGGIANADEACQGNQTSHCVPDACFIYIGGYVGKVTMEGVQKLLHLDIKYDNFPTWE